MVLGRTLGVALVGLTGHVVDVEAHLAPSLPAFTLVGLPDASLTESRDRVRAAVTSSGMAWPNRRITVNLSPATLPKSGSSFDLAIAVATLAGAETIGGAGPHGTVHLGELGLDGRVRPVRGVLPAVAAAVAAGRCRVVVAEANVAEARLVPGAEVVGARSLAEVAASYGAEVAVPTLPAVDPEPVQDRMRPATLDLADVMGQDDARACLEVAAAGSHHLLLVGPPGTGKTMLAARLPGLLPDLSEADAVEVTAVHSVAGAFDPREGLLRRPPFEDPHHTATPASVIGGGSGVPRPGAASRAHRGVLFLDEAPEFSTAVLQTLRQPLEHGELVLHRAAGTARYPARFQLVLAANPCPCGQAVGKGLACTCRSEQRRRYFGKLSGPLLDRVDLQVELGPARSGSAAGESTAQVAARVLAAREAQAHRLVATPWRTNGEVPGGWLRDRLGPDRSLMGDLDRALDRGTLSLRGVDRVLRVAWTLADLEGRDAPGRSEVGQALLLRTRGNGA
ncbi:YifB family Mg chelatase-like AAA ATPase [Cellulomonas sp. URHE0023]|uniref:YifB family Mg chelatase-like AAA ATPase n=1 Tax=Cellulomonas sp. URHE0023 TaxID=1380354 RepID=UPI000487C089|nr:YifB family Mg chelatase-like AAA ATPase [Cellulomonas sp. URHE0023]